MPIVASYSMPVGASQAIPYSAFQTDGVTPFNLTGYTLRFSLSRTLPSGGVYTLQKSSPSGGIVVNNAAGGLATITFLTADTVNLTPDVYFFDVIALNGIEEVPLTTGTFQLTERASR